MTTDTTPTTATIARPPAVLDGLRMQLGQRAAVLRQELAVARAREFPGGREPGDREVADLEDAAGEAALETVADAEMQRDLDELHRVEAALLRLQQGHYGQCADCGDEIDLQRLHAQPAALRCAACQQRVEAASTSLAAIPGIRGKASRPVHR